MLDPFSHQLMLLLLLSRQTGLYIAGSCLLLQKGTVNRTTPSPSSSAVGETRLADLGLQRIRHKAEMLSGSLDKLVLAWGMRVLDWHRTFGVLLGDC